MLDFFKKISQNLSSTNQTDLDEYIKERQPKNAGDVERIIQEYTYKQMRGWI